MTGDYATDEQMPPEPDQFRQFQPPQGPPPQPQQRQMQPPPQAPPPPEDDGPVTPQDQLLLSRFQNAKSQVEQDQMKGVITPQTAQQALGGIMPGLTKLQQKQQRQQARQAGQMAQQTMQQMAQQRAIEDVHGKMDVQSFPQTNMVHVPDPITGETYSFYRESNNGPWKQVKASEAGRPEQSFSSPDVGYTPADGTSAGEGGTEGQMYPGPSSLATLGLGMAGEAVAGAPLPAGHEALPASQGGPQDAMSLEQFGAQQRGSSSGEELPRILNSAGENIDARTRPPRPADGEDPDNPLTAQVIKKTYELANKNMPALDGNASPHEKAQWLATRDATVEKMLNHKLLLHRHRLDRKAEQERNAEQLKLRSQQALLDHETNMKKLTAEQKIRREDAQQMEQNKGWTRKEEVENFDRQLGILDRKRDKLRKEYKEAHPEDFDFKGFKVPDNLDPAKDEENAMAAHRRDVQRFGGDRQGKEGGLAPGPKEVKKDLPPKQQFKAAVAAAQQPGAAEPVGTLARVNELLPTLEAGLKGLNATEGKTWLGRTVQGDNPTHAPLYAMHKVLATAARENRDLLPEERRVYEMNFEHLNGILKQHKQNAEGLRLEVK